MAQDRAPLRTERLRVRLQLSLYGKPSLKSGISDAKATGWTAKTGSRARTPVALRRPAGGDASASGGGAGDAVARRGRTTRTGSAAYAQPEASLRWAATDHG